MAARKKAGKKVAKPNGGRPPSVMTPVACAKIAALVAQGNYTDVAARAVGVEPSTVRKHKSRNAAFAAQLDQAKAMFESEAIGTIVTASKKHWQASAWLAERRFPERWSRPEIRQSLVNVNIDTQDLAKAIHAGLGIVAKLHADFSKPDSDA